MMSYESRMAEIDRLRDAASGVDPVFAVYLAAEIEDRMLGGKSMDSDAYHALRDLAKMVSA